MILAGYFSGVFPCSVLPSRLRNKLYAQYLFKQLTGPPRTSFCFKGLPQNASPWSGSQGHSQGQIDTLAPSTVLKAYVSECHEEHVAWDKPKSLKQVTSRIYFLTTPAPDLPGEMPKAASSSDVTRQPCCRSFAFHPEDKSDQDKHILPQNCPLPAF